MCSDFVLTKAIFKNRRSQWVKFAFRGHVSAKRFMNASHSPSKMRHFYNILARASIAQAVCFEELLGLAQLQPTGLDRLKSS